MGLHVEGGARDGDLVVVLGGAQLVEAVHIIGVVAGAVGDGVPSAIQAAAATVQGRPVCRDGGLDERQAALVPGFNHAVVAVELDIQLRAGKRRNAGAAVLGAVYLEPVIAAPPVVLQVELIAGELDIFIRVGRQRVAAVVVVGVVVRVVR